MVKGNSKEEAISDYIESLKEYYTLREIAAERSQANQEAFDMLQRNLKRVA